MNPEAGGVAQDASVASIGPTFVVTDVVDSTKLAARLGEERNARLWNEHDRAARALVASWQGQELERTDGIVVALSQPEDAVGFALEYRAALSRLDPPLEARIGLHRGSGGATDPYDVVRTTHRVAELAHGDQILLTRGAVPDGPLTARSLGFWRLDPELEPVELLAVPRTDGSEPMPVETQDHYRVVRSGVTWLPARSASYALPAERDPFVGRTDDLKALSARLAGPSRLVTVTGAAGTGKTRLATRFGWSQLGAFPGGVWFCDLSEARTLGGLCYALAVVFDVPLGESPIERLGHAIVGRGRCLVILDNFEQLVGHARATLGQWLVRSNEARFVVTSREVLGLPGETTLALRTMTEDDAVQLFADRAAAARREFAVNEGNRPAVRELVRLLDHLPLAIELAASRVRVLTPERLVVRMNERFEVLRATSGRVPRQATLRAALDWSWELLEPDEQAALAQLSVYEGGFTLDGAEAFLDLAESWPMDVVQALVDKSLLQRVGDRFGLLVSVQAYARERLDERGERAAAEARHGARFAEYGTDEAIAGLYVHGGVQRQRALQTEFDNLMAAFSRATARGDAAVAVPVLRGLFAILEFRGLTSLLDELADDAASLTLSEEHRATVATLQARARWRLGRLDEAEGFAEEALALHRAAGRRFHEGQAVGTVGLLRFVRGRLEEGQRLLEEAHAIARGTGNRRFEGVYMALLALIALHRGQVGAARYGLHRALAIHQEVGNRPEEGVVLGNLGMLETQAERPAEAEGHLAAALEVHRETGFRLAEGFAWLELGALRLRGGAHATAREAIEQGRRILGEVGDRTHEGRARGLLGQLDGLEGRHEAMFENFAQSAAIFREVGARREEAQMWLRIGQERARRRQLAEAASAIGSASRLVESLDNPRLTFDLRTGQALLDASWGDVAAARTKLAQAEAMADELGLGPEAPERSGLAEVRAVIDGVD